MTATVRYLTPRPQPIGHFIQIGSNRHHQLETLHGSGRLPVRRVVAETASADRRARQAAKLNTGNPGLKRALEKASLRLDRMRAVLEDLDEILGREHTRSPLLRQRWAPGRTGHGMGGS
jgi:hypothetical protein